jgi:hypothetical protein
VAQKGFETANALSARSNTAPRSLSAFVSAITGPVDNAKTLERLFAIASAPTALIGSKTGPIDLRALRELTVLSAMTVLPRRCDAVVSFPGPNTHSSRKLRNRSRALAPRQRRGAIVIDRGSRAPLVTGRSRRRHLRGETVQRALRLEELHRTANLLTKSFGRSMARLRNPGAASASASSVKDYGLLWPTRDSMTSPLHLRRLMRLAAACVVVRRLRCDVHAPMARPPGRCNPRCDLDERQADE